MTSICEQLVGSYQSWLQDNLTCGQINGAYQITTPFKDNHNDRIQIYVVPEGTHFLLTDDGYTIHDLIQSGVELTTKKRQEIFTTAIRSYGVNVDSEDALTIRADTSNFPQKVHDLIQAILSIGDLHYLSRRQVQSLFRDDVERLFAEYEIPVVSDIRLAGKSGLDQTFDFIIARTKAKPEQVIKLISSVRKDRIEALIFEWYDVKDIRMKGSDYIPIIDDVSRSVKDEALQVFTAYDIHPRLFSDLKKNPMQLVTA